MTPRHYADPTAWKAIANVEREQKKRNHGQKQTKQQQVGVYRDKTIVDKQAHITSVQTLVRQENISLLARIKLANRNHR